MIIEFAIEAMCKYQCYEKKSYFLLILSHFIHEKQSSQHKR